MVDDSVPDQLQCTTCLLPMQYQSKIDGKFLWQCFKCGKKYFVSENIDDNIEQKQATQLPEPTGYRILIAIPDKEEKTEGGILKAQETLHYEEVSSIVGFVMKMGPDCYKDETRFPTGPWCQVGDFVLFRSIQISPTW